MKRVIGITGGIASGKSNVCKVIRELGYPVIDCDEITRRNYEINGKIYKVVLERFGNEFLLDDGNINRKKVGKLVFTNSSAKMLLNSITHPIIKQELLTEIAKYSDGGLRDAINLLDQILSLNNENITMDDVYSLIGIYNEDKIFEFIEYLLNGNVDKLLNLLMNIMKMKKIIYIYAIK
mgnify:CR=1 FL=1